MSTLLGEWGFLDNLEDTSGWEHSGVFKDSGAPAAFSNYVDGPLPGTRAAKLGHDNHSIELGRTGLEPVTGGVVILFWFKVDSAAPTTAVMTGLVSKAKAGFSSRCRVGYHVQSATHIRMSYAVRWKDDLHYEEPNATLITKGVWHEVMLQDHENFWGLWVDGVQLAYGNRSGLPADPAPWEDFSWIIGRNITIGDQWGSEYLSISAVRIFSGTDFSTTTERAKWANVLRVTAEPWSFYDFAEGTGNANSNTGQGIRAVPASGASWGGVHKAVGQFNDCYPWWVDFGSSYIWLREWTVVFDFKVNALPVAVEEYDTIGVKGDCQQRGDASLTQAMWLQWTTDGKPTLYWTLASDEIMTSSVVLIPGTQHELIYLSTGAKMEMWLDGVKVAETSTVIDLNTGGSEFKLLLGGFNGELNALRAYRHGLTPAQIAALPTPDYLESEDTTGAVRIYLGGAWTDKFWRTEQGGVWIDRQARTYDDPLWVPTPT